MPPNKFSVGSQQWAVGNPDSLLSPIFHPCQLPTANSSLPSLSTQHSQLSTILLPCPLPTPFPLLSALFSTHPSATSLIVIIFPLMPEGENCYGFLVFDFKQGNISGIPE